MTLTASTTYLISTDATTNVIRPRRHRVLAGDDVALAAGAGSVGNLVRMHAASEILSARHYVQVRGIHARSIPTEMIELLAGRDWSDKVLVDETMGDALHTVNHDAAIASAFLVTCPNPASSFWVYGVPLQGGFMLASRSPLACTGEGTVSTSLRREASKDHAALSADDVDLVFTVKALMMPKDEPGRLPLDVAQAGDISGCNPRPLTTSARTKPRRNLMIHNHSPSVTSNYTTGVFDSTGKPVAVLKAA